MKFKRSDVVRGFSGVPEIRCESDDHVSLTSFAGLVIFQRLFRRMAIKRRLRKCFGHLRQSATYRGHDVVLWMILHLILGFRKLRDRDYYHDDPMPKRLLGLNRLPDVATISRSLAAMDERAVEAYRTTSRELVLDRIEYERLTRVTVDFDGSVLSTARHAEGTAIGFNKKKRGARSYYPLFCTVAQTGQILDLHHRPGNVHDSNGAKPFIASCVEAVRERSPRAALEARVDSAFFDEDQLVALHESQVEFTASVPFARFPKLKEVIESRRRWRRIDDSWSYFECDWKPDCWTQGFRILVIRQKKAVPTKGPLQLHLFEPRSHEYDYQVIVTNKRCSAKRVMEYHHGRGSQEGVFAEAKQFCQLEYVPVRTLHGNRVYCLSAVMAHNLTRELQIETWQREHGTTAKRRNLWGFETLGTLRNRLIRRAGRLIRPQGRLTLVIPAGAKLREELELYAAG
ncbi:MAG: IS1380 family transposase [Planctomycetota bacterium]